MPPLSYPNRRPPTALFLVVLVALGLILVGCSPTAPSSTGAPPEPLVLETIPPGTCGVTLPEEVDDTTRVHMLIEAEGQLMAAREIGPLMALWAEESRVINAKNRPEDVDNYQIWRGKDAIRHRYLNVVFPSAPESVATVTLDITIDGEEAIARGTTQIGGETSINGDRWAVHRIDGCWQIMELIYNLEPLESQPTESEPDQNPAP